LSAPTRPPPGRIKMGRRRRPGRAGPRPRSGRVRHQAARWVRRPRATGRDDRHPRPSVGHRSGRVAVGGSRAGGGGGGPGARQRRPGGGDRIPRGGGGHPVAGEPDGATGTGPTHLPGAERVRAVLAAGQAVPTGGHPAREAGGRLPGVRLGGRRHGDVAPTRATQASHLLSTRPNSAPPSVANSVGLAARR
jgi:hypothetical protein